MSPGKEIKEVQDFLEKPHRVQRKRTKGWRMPENTVYVGRPSKYGNPFTVEGAIEVGYAPEDARNAIVHAHKECINGNPDYCNNDKLKKYSELCKGISDLQGKNLACFCRLDQPCHADYLLELANQTDCPSCDGAGIIEDMVQTIDCCGNCLPDGQCCNNPVPGQKLIQDYCLQCEGKGKINV